MNYPDLFGKYELLKFNFEGEENFDKSIEVLNRIFAPNPNYWGDRSNLWLHIGKERLMVPLLIDSGDIKIYKYTLKEPIDPKNEDRLICYSLKNLGRVKSEVTFQLYWRAYNFFKNKGFYLRTSTTRNSTYLGLTLDKRKSIENEGFSYEDVEDIKEDLRSDILSQYNSIVRCGEIEGYRLLELANKNNYVWIFPFIYGDYYNENEITCYLFEFTDRYEKIQYEEMKEAFSKLKK